ncbi:hypothetical protein SBOR_1742 [Sclerotinia borealis F-4128]|uniref:Calcineurin-like phosphoesterase domain-containing protein n=1 Tax=Sclerotinia borealis (strain F-4128) TaxID=1432307 RepID=W9CPV9_SCLBF|nr:hypothetical protein SBOR_1742 [Sclerotinia borealis F-4128]
MLSNFDAELKLVIAGNHDLELDEGWCREHLDEDEDYLQDHARAMEIMQGQFARDAGRRSKYMFLFINRNNNDYAFPYKRSEDRFSVSGETAQGITSIAENPMPGFAGVDIVMTHGPPKGIRDECKDGHQGCDHILRAIKRVKPLMHCFGHIYKGYGAHKVVWEESVMKKEIGLVNSYPRPTDVSVESEKETLMVNAAILDGEHRPTNAPWILNLDLPSA